MQRPLFVPILITMDEQDHGLVAEEAQARPAADYDGSGPADGELHERELAEGLARMRALQEYLVTFEAAGLPVVKLQYGDFGDVLDKLHEYILQCIKLAMMPV
jgi:hypothetical protein